MTRRLLPIFVSVGLALTASVASAALNGTDIASNYGSFNNGANGGTGFEAWSISGNNNSSTIFSGSFIGDSTAGAGNINTSNVAFGLYANPNGAFIDAFRAFSGGGLTSGQVFSFNISVDFRNGNKGFSLRDGGTQILNFNIGSDQYQVNSATTGSGNLALAYSADSVFAVTITQTSAAGGTFSIQRTSTAEGPFTGTYTGEADNFQFYNSGTDNGDSANNLYFNNLQVVPEPSVMFMCVAGLAGLRVMQRMRSKS